MHRATDHARTHQQVHTQVCQCVEQSTKQEPEQASAYAQLAYMAAQVKQQLRKMKEKAISRGKWQGSGGPKGAQVISELVDWEVRPLLQQQTPVKPLVHRLMTI